MHSGLAHSALIGNVQDIRGVPAVPMSVEKRGRVRSGELASRWCGKADLLLCRRGRNDGESAVSLRMPGWDYVTDPITWKYMFVGSYFATSLKCSRFCASGRVHYRVTNTCTITSHAELRSTETHPSEKQDYSHDRGAVVHIAVTCRACMQPGPLPVGRFIGRRDSQVGARHTPAVQYAVRERVVRFMPASL